MQDCRKCQTSFLPWQILEVGLFLETVYMRYFIILQQLIAFIPILMTLAKFKVTARLVEFKLVFFLIHLCENCMICDTVIWTS